MATQSKTYNIVEGTSKPQQFELQDDEAAFDATGLDVDVEVYLNGTIVTSNAPTVAWLDQSASTVEVSGVENLTPGEYHVRYKLTYSDATVDYLPGGPNVVEADRWIIKPRYA